MMVIFLFRLIWWVIFSYNNFFRQTMHQMLWVKAWNLCTEYVTPWVTTVYNRLWDIHDYLQHIIHSHRILYSVYWVLPTRCFTASKRINMSNTINDHRKTSTYALIVLYACDDNCRWYYYNNYHRSRIVMFSTIKNQLISHHSIIVHQCATFLNVLHYTSVSV